MMGLLAACYLLSEVHELGTKFSRVSVWPK